MVDDGVYTTQAVAVTVDEGNHYRRPPQCDKLSRLALSTNFT